MTLGGRSLLSVSSIHLPPHATFRNALAKGDVDFVTEATGGPPSKPIPMSAPLPAPVAADADAAVVAEIDHVGVVGIDPHGVEVAVDQRAGG